MDPLVALSKACEYLVINVQRKPTAADTIIISPGMQPEE